jgi:plasmid maintenance system killer protein
MFASICSTHVQRDDLFAGLQVARFAKIRVVAEHKLQMLLRATRLDDLRVPPNNRLEALKHDRNGQHSICINDIVCERHAVTVDTALRLANYFGPSACSLS